MREFGLMGNLGLGTFSAMLVACALNPTTASLRETMQGDEMTSANNGKQATTKHDTSTAESSLVSSDYDPGIAAAEQLAADEALAALPSDEVITAASDADLARLLVRCVPVEGMTYCLHWGWESLGAASPTIRDLGNTTGVSTSSGDASPLEELRRWSGKQWAERARDEAAELAEARAAAGKMLLMNGAIFGARIPSDFDQRHPQLAAMRAQLTTARAGSSAMTNAAASICDNPVSSDCAFLMSDSKLAKQSTGWYCGPTSLQGLAWNDPKASQYQTQAYWASILGTTESNGTYVGNLKSAINTYTHWDDADYAGAYVVVGIASWSEQDYRNLFRNHLRTLRSPVQLHPVLTKGVTTSYYPGNTSGHYNVARGYDFTSGQDWVWLHEPATAGGAYTSVEAWETVHYIRLAQLANTANRNIVY
jgi:hypothetical protein